MPQKKPLSQQLTQQQAIEMQRDLAKFANIMDSVVRIPFTRQGVGADAALGTIPVAGDVAGFALTCYAVFKAKQVGVPQHKLNPIIRLAVIDGVVGFIPVVGTLFDVFIRPSRKALDVVQMHIQEQYDIRSDSHIVHPFLHEKLQAMQQNSAFWRNPVVSWLWLHIPDFIGLIILSLMALLMWWGASSLWAWSQTL